MNLREFLDTVRLYRKTFALAALPVLVLGLAWLVFSPLQYVSTAQLLVSVNGTSTANAYQNDSVVAGRVKSYVALLTSDVVSQRVVDKLDLKMSPGQLAAKISAVQVPPSTAVIDIAVTDPSAEQARRIAATVADEFVTYSAAIESPTGEDAQKVQTRVISQASQPRSRVAEKLAIAGLVALLAALAGAVAVWIRSATDRVIKTARQGAAAADLPVVGTVEPGAASSLAALDPYRRLRTTLSRQSAAVIQLSPVDVDVDTTTIAKNLARVSALSGHRSVVVDATGDPAEQQDVTRGDDGEPDVWHAGAWASDPDLAASAQASTLIDQLKRDYEQVVIATPPALSNPVASGLSDHADAVVLVVTPGRTKKADVGRVADDIRAVGGHLVGVLSTTDDSSVDEADGS